MQGPSLDVDVYRYAFPGWAKLAFRVDQPPHVYDWPNINDERSTLDFAPQADAQQVSCGIGDAGNCMMWFIRLRYGQYCVLISYISHDGPEPGPDSMWLTDTEARQLAAPLIEQVESQLA